MAKSRKACAWGFKLYKVMLDSDSEPTDLKLSLLTACPIDPHLQCDQDVSVCYALNPNKPLDLKVRCFVVGCLFNFY